MLKGAIRWALNHIPRSWLQRMAGWAVPIMGLGYLVENIQLLSGSNKRGFND